jgi:hypothetical protein
MIDAPFSAYVVFLSQVMRVGYFQTATEVSATVIVMNIEQMKLPAARTGWVGFQCYVPSTSWRQA